ncbi:hypothetical protein COO60DRAFT_331456 [Scenedesmus sp. NREL 46B-D3]|nr:hypothetical protein COO60DRAFT_331456 [Scenedesmus sp. NREL 46B-D3]
MYVCELVCGMLSAASHGLVPLPSQQLEGESSVPCFYWCLLELVCANLLCWCLCWHGYCMSKACLEGVVLTAFLSVLMQQQRYMATCDAWRSASPKTQLTMTQHLTATLWPAESALHLGWACACVCECGLKRFERRLICETFVVVMAARAATLPAGCLTTYAC